MHAQKEFEQNIIENMEYSEEIKNLQTQLAEIDKKIQEARQIAILRAQALIQQYNIKPEELKEKQEEKEETPPV